jgi:hypothetical protein
MPYSQKTTETQMALIEISTKLSAPLAQVAQHTATPALLNYVASPLIRFMPMQPAYWPEQWADGGEYRANLLQFGFIPIGWQIIRTSIVSIQEDRYVLCDHGQGLLAKHWDHTITLQKSSNNATLYSDKVDIQAGWLTPFIVGFAHIFYRWRQRRWHRLIANQFNYSL